ncbi:MAG: hypothetical protein E3J66_00085 [Dehalococcoidia bacterium]|nr:MAG: hypothetical protein E3J66_00085 [Dehalococcoidia bacterium]
MKTKRQKRHRRSNDRKSEQLGMPYGTAYHRLRKMIMFGLVRRLGEDICFRCGEKIETIAEFSIEHKECWQNVDVALFWDLDNIAFSHLICNLAAKDEERVRVAGRKGAAARGDQRYVGPLGTAWCCDCQDFLPVGKFSRNQRHWNGYQYYCKEHMSIRNREYRKRKKAQEE